MVNLLKDKKKQVILGHIIALWLQPILTLGVSGHRHIIILYVYLTGPYRVPVLYFSHPSKQLEWPIIEEMEFMIKMERNEECLYHWNNSNYIAWKTNFYMVDLISL